MSHACSASSRKDNDPIEVGLLKKGRSAASAAPSARPCDVRKNTSMERGGGPRRRLLSDTIRRCRNVARRSRERPVMVLIVCVRTWWTMSRRANSKQRSSRTNELSLRSTFMTGFRVWGFLALASHTELISFGLTGSKKVAYSVTDIIDIHSAVKCLTPRTLSNAATAFDQCDRVEPGATGPCFVCERQSCYDRLVPIGATREVTCVSRLTP
jgi:hypothetical protein